MKTLPINDVLTELQAALNKHHEVILEAPPGAGKTTGVPLALLDSAWLDGKQILMLEPRRVAARAAAERMASQLGEKVGETIGYQVRHENKVSKHTKIIVVTEGILTRRLQSDPGLENIALVIFDEFHERNLDGDLGLALCKQSREYFRDEAEPLKLLLMSATLNSDVIQRVLKQAPVVRSEGRSYSVEIEYSSHTAEIKKNICAGVCATIKKAIHDHDGSLLVFLPGRAEIDQVEKQLIANVLPTIQEKISVRPLHGSLSLDQQRSAISPITNTTFDRKVVLATDIAETSLTIDGVRVVIDSGLTRKPVFDSRTSMTRLNTTRISLASATQRAGRAGRVEPGVAIRMWSPHDEAQFVKHSAPEIEQTDLSSFALQLFSWGVNHPSELELIDQPQEGAFNQARELLLLLGAIAIDNNTGHIQLTEHGKVLSQIPAHPRLAHMLTCAVNIKQSELGACIAAIIEERDPFRDWGANIESRIAILQNEEKVPAFAAGWKKRTLRQKKQLLDICKTIQAQQGALTASRNPLDSKQEATGYLLACAYTDRIAKRQQNTKYKLANGRQAALDETDTLQRDEWLVIADLGGFSGSKIDRIFSAASFNVDIIESRFPHCIEKHHLADWSTRANRFVSETHFHVGKLHYKTLASDQIDDAQLRHAVLNYIKKTELSALTWSEEAKQLCARVSLIRDTMNSTQEGVNAENTWPDFSNASLIETSEVWLAPYLNQVRTLTDIKKLNTYDMLCSRLDWSTQQELENLAPTRVEVPSGSKIKIDYGETPPVLAVKLQEMFGCATTPTILGGKIKLSIHLLSPARRPLQITQDLKHFWQTSYVDVKKEMKGRYPKHPWPDDPLSTEATRFTKNRMNKSN